MNKDILNIDYQKIKLDNGLEVILYKNKSLPIVSVNIWYKVGSANEKPGKTGFAHLFEHMMFQGSQNVPKEKHFKYIQEAGGSLNGSTGFDRTNYYETLPSNQLELALWLESDRMGFLLPALTEEKLQNQKDVVMNERRQRYENQPYGLAWEKVFGNLYSKDHPYNWPTIGFMDDIKNFELNDVVNFFKTYYSPQNASLVIAGDIDYSNSLKLVEKYFGEFSSKAEITKIKTQNHSLLENIKLIHEDNVQLPRIYLAWHSDKLYGPDDAKLDILSDVLTGSKNSRLYKSLVFDKQIAQDVTSFQYSANLSGSFIIIATAKPNVSLESLKNEIFSELKILSSNGISEREISRAKNGIKSSFIYSLQNIESLANHINNYNCNLGEPNSFMYDVDRYDKVGIEEIPVVSTKYLSQPFAELQIIPKPK